MDLPRNTLKEALAAGRKQIGLWVSGASPDSAELLAGCGYDWLVFDLEHSTTSPSEAVALLRAAAPYPVSPVVRPGWNDPVEIKRLLDGGAQTIVVPYVQTAEEARAAVRALRYPPEGIRGVSGITRASRYGRIADYGRRAAEELCLIVQVETAEALGQVEEIAAVDGVDCVFIGPADLAASMGRIGEGSHAEVRAAVLEGIARIRSAGKPAGLLSLDQSFLREAEEAGALFLGVDIDYALLQRAALARREEWR
ncbi:HpcH/HpaI aldolase family protein [Histidinibacterium aquaticum]|uniref:4-hydroxy-2-oxo-heptane-1,7-dioate aldolase n=1 Tax=Histidinibacterium aquaticum TaxID=2613962 RepID=A0A5J5GHT8_9RHOB|nr:aldolase/citrate lyase family protein [Histidinibacterium aquaticum]KAA9007799.1 4-hydroxy-2-oxo-heptane-1,7-dioate aldolase [Histidinibacterium aquaticum]